LRLCLRSLRIDLRLRVGLLADDLPANLPREDLISFQDFPVMKVMPLAFSFSSRLFFFLRYPPARIFPEIIHSLFHKLPHQLASAAPEIFSEHIHFIGCFMVESDARVPAQALGFQNGSGTTNPRVSQDSVKLSNITTGNNIPGGEARNPIPPFVLVRPWQRPVGLFLAIDVIRQESELYC
jgi:hypothetical protein